MGRIVSKALAPLLAARDAAGYHTHVSLGNRCDGCAHSRRSNSSFNRTRYDRACVRWHLIVKTHGTCAEYTPKWPLRPVP